MLIGPRIREGNDGYLVVTPLERDGQGSTILVNRGWIPKKRKRQADRREGLPMGEVRVEGLLREPWKKNMFTPDNKPELGEFYFPDVQQMARLTGSQPVWIEETMGQCCGGHKSPYLDADVCLQSPTCSWHTTEKPRVFQSVGLRKLTLETIIRNISLLGESARIWVSYDLYLPHPKSSLCVNTLAHNKTRYALSAATSVMLWMVIRKPPSDIARRVRQNKEW